MRRRSLVNGVLLGIALALALALLLWPAGGPDRAPRLTPLAPAEIHALTLTYPRNGDGNQPEITLERRDDGWHITRPIERPARDGRVVTALGVLAARTPSCYDLAEHDPADFGLAPPRLILRTGDTTLAFGSRSPDGRRYLRAGERLCLVADRGYPLLAGGLDTLAAPSVLAPGAVPLRIETPQVIAARPDRNADWTLAHGNARDEEIRRWVARWRAAQARSFVLDPSSADHGRIRIQTANGPVRGWRIARPPPDLVLVPTGADYGLRIAGGGAALLQPPPGAAAPPAGR